MNRLYVLYDDRCGLCLWARRWVERQEAFLPLHFVPAGSEAAGRMFPQLARTDPPEELFVVSDEGGVYRGGSAWIMVLYALVDYREWSFRLASPVLLPLARAAFANLSKQRGLASRWLGLEQEDDQLAATLRQDALPACELVPVAPTIPKRVTPPARGRWAREFSG